MSDLFTQSCSNNGYGQRFTCRGCYADLDYAEWRDKRGKCPNCDRPVHCYVDMKPVSVCDLIDEEELEYE